MKKVLLASLIALGCLMLYSQTQTLPDIKVTGESEIKPHLQKRNLEYSSASEGTDSLSGYLPQSLLLSRPERKIKPRKLRGYLQLEANSEPGAGSYLSFYPNSDFIRRISHQFSFQKPADDTSHLNSDLTIGYTLSDSLPLLTKLIYFDDKSTNYQAKALGMNLNMHIPKLHWGSVVGKDISIQGSYDKLQLHNLTKDMEIDHFGILLSVTAEYSWLNLKAKYLNHYASGSAYLAPYLHWEPFGIKGLRVGVLSDAQHYYPTLEFRLRATLAEGINLIVSNEPEISTLNYSDLLGKYPWLDIDDNPQQNMIPMNMNTTLELLKAGTNVDSSLRIQISNQLEYRLDAPCLLSGINPGVAGLNYSNLLNAISGVTLIYHHGKMMLKQSLQLNLAYLAQHNFEIAAYVPRYQVDTHIGYRYQNWALEAGFTQLFNAHDHLRRSLPESILLSLGVSYSIKNNVVYLNMDNLLDKSYCHFTEYPAQGRTLSLGIKQRF